MRLMNRPSIVLPLSAVVSGVRAASVLAVVGALGAAACGPSYGGQDVKTPEELIEEQDRIQAEEDKSRKARGIEDEAYTSEETDSEKKRKFDEKQSKMEMSRATRSAESCPGVVIEQETKENKQRGETRVSVTFQEDGTVRQVSIPSPFDGTPVGECVMRAYKSIIVPPFTGGDQIVDWDVSLKDPPKEAGAKKK
jgi:hypothetical protein